MGRVYWDTRRPGCARSLAVASGLVGGHCGCVSSVYEFPEYYDILFGWDRSAEAEFYEYALVQHGVPSGASIIEVAAGTAQIGIRLASKGWRVTALDCSEAMLAFASFGAERVGFALETLVADMADFRVDHSYRGALNPMSSFRLLQHDVQIVGHLDCLADALVGGSVYLIDTAFGTDGSGASDLDEWVMQRDGITVTATSRDVQVVDLPRGREVTLDWHDALRPYAPDDFARLVEAHGKFGILGCYPEAGADHDGVSHFGRALHRDLPKDGRAIVVLSRR
jgi:hypothetical protein